MAYTAEISRNNPTCIIFTIDQSGSMEDPFGGSTDETQKRKADGVADATNRLIQNLVIRCAKEDGIRDYFHVAVIGYGDQKVESAFVGTLAGKDVVPISEIGSNPARLEERVKEKEDGAGGLIKEEIKLPIWFDPICKGGTPMCAALIKAKTLCEEWLAKYPNGFPPIVINITDGEATDGDPTIPADDLRKLASSDGEVMLLNLHLSSQKATPIQFPDNEENLPDEFAKRLFYMSSLLTSNMRKEAEQERITTSEKTRGFVFNADMIAVIKFLNIGTRPSNLR